MTRQERISSLLAELSPVHLEVLDESHRHKGGHESHYNVTVVSPAFAAASRLERHRRVHGLLAAELASGLHALTLTLRTPAEHRAIGAALVSPSCLGGPTGDA